MNIAATVLAALLAFALQLGLASAAQGVVGSVELATMLALSLLAAVLQRRLAGRKKGGV